MPYTTKQEQLLHARGIKHHHDIDFISKILRIPKSRLYISKIKNTKMYIVTKLKKNKPKIKLGDKVYIIS